jgi:arylsulfatase A-like enzyme
LLDIYPTLLELCDLPPRPKLEGVSLLPLLRNPVAEWERPSLTTHGRGNHAVRTQLYRYIRYADGSEELYDHTVDPMEWKNLADDDSLTAVKQDLAKWLPKK